MKVDVQSPEEYLGEVIGDINSRRGQISELGNNSCPILCQTPCPILCQIPCQIVVLHQISRSNLAVNQLRNPYPSTTTVHP